MTLGEFIRHRRWDVLRLGLREFCLKHEIDSGRWSVIEQGFAKPTSLDVLAGILDIHPGSEDFKRLRRLYFEHTPRLPTEQEVNGRLPISLRLGEATMLRLRDEIQTQMHHAIEGVHPI